MFLKFLTIGLSLTNAVSGHMLLQEKQVPVSDAVSFDDGWEQPSTDEMIYHQKPVRPDEPVRPIEEYATKPPPLPPREYPDFVCTKDSQPCWDGSVVERVPHRGCVFAACPIKEDEIVLCDDSMIELRKEQVKESRCIDDCDCISMYMTSLASLECVIPDSTMDVIENSHEIYHHCKDEEGESVIKPRQDLLRETQNDCRGAHCDIKPEIIDKYETKDEEMRDEYDRIYEVSEYGVMTTIIDVEEDLKPKSEPIRDVDSIFDENNEIRELVNKCLPDCNGVLDQSMCEIVERVMTGNCTIVCEIDESDVKKEVLSSCDTFGNKKESIDMMAEFGGFDYSSGVGDLWGMGLIGTMLLARV